MIDIRDQKLQECAELFLAHTNGRYAYMTGHLWYLDEDDQWYWRDTKIQFVRDLLHLRNLYAKIPANDWIIKSLGMTWIMNQVQARVKLLVAVNRLPGRPMTLNLPSEPPTPGSESAPAP